MPTPIPTARTSPHSARKHRRDVLWQVALPLLAAAAGAGVLMFLAASPAQAGRISAFADVSLIFLILPVMAGGLVALALIAGLCTALFFGGRELPPLLRRALDFMLTLASRTRMVAGRLTDGVSSARSVALSARGALADLRRWLPFGTRDE